jgi:hypothetical protein
VLEETEAGGDVGPLGVLLLMTACRAGTPGTVLGAYAEGAWTVGFAWIVGAGLVSGPGWVPGAGVIRLGDGGMSVPSGGSGASGGGVRLLPQ